MSTNIDNISFRGKDGLYAARIPRRGKPMGGDLSAGCGGENINFSTPFETIKHN